MGFLRLALITTTGDTPKHMTPPTFDPDIWTQTHAPARRRSLVVVVGLGGMGMHMGMHSRGPSTARFSEEWSRAVVFAAASRRSDMNYRCM